MRSNGPSERAAVYPSREEPRDQFGVLWIVLQKEYARLTAHRALGADPGFRWQVPPLGDERSRQPAISERRLFDPRHYSTPLGRAATDCDAAWAVSGRSSLARAIACTQNVSQGSSPSALNRN